MPSADDEAMSGWARLDAPPPLPDGEVHVWRIALDVAPEPQGLAALLAPDEAERAAAFRFDLHRRRYIVGRARLRQVLGSYVGVAPAALQLSYGPRGKPRLAAGPVCFNLSHAEGLALLGVGRLELGVDVERLVREMDLPSVARVCFSERELAELEALGEPRLRDGFFAGWTRKEALLKAWGSGLAFPLKDFDVTLHPERPPSLLRLEGDAAAPSRWQLYDVFPAPGFRGAVATPAPVRVRTWAWPDERLGA